MGDARHRITRDRFLQKQRGARDNARHDVGIRISRYVEALRRPVAKFLRRPCADSVPTRGVMRSPSLSGTGVSLHPKSAQAATLSRARRVSCSVSASLKC
jgi:hypothetical protein